jgi:hypothetical protein
VLNATDHLLHARNRSDIRLDQQVGRLAVRQQRACCSGNCGAARLEATHHGLAHALGAPGDENPLAANGFVSCRATRRGLWLTAPDPSSGLHDVERNAGTFDEARAAEGGGDDLVRTAARTE